MLMKEVGIIECAIHCCVHKCISYYRDITTFLHFFRSFVVYFLQEPDFAVVLNLSLVLCTNFLSSPLFTIMVIIRESVLGIVHATIQAIDNDKAKFGLYLIPRELCLISSNSHLPTASLPLSYLYSLNSSSDFRSFHHHYFLVVIKWQKKSWQLLLDKIHTGKKSFAHKFICLKERKIKMDWVIQISRDFLTLFIIS